MINGLLLRLLPLCPITSGAAGAVKASPVTSIFFTRLFPALGRTVSGVIPMEDRCHFQSSSGEPAMARDQLRWLWLCCKASREKREKYRRIMQTEMSGYALNCGSCPFMFLLRRIYFVGRFGRQPPLSHAMRAPNYVAVGLLVCSYGFLTGSSFYFSQPTRWKATALGRRPHNPDHVSSIRTSRSPRAQRPKRSKRNPNSCVAEDAATAATQEEKRATRDDVERLSRAELQAICKSLNLRAVGKTSELLSRVLENYDQQQQQQPSGAEATRLVPPPAATSTDTVTAANTGVVESLEGATIDQLLSAVDSGIGSGSSSSSSTSSSGGGAREATTTRAEVPAAAPPTDFVMEDVRPVFDELSDEQWAKVGQLGQLLTEWNGKINLISRKDIANVMKRHLIPCLAMAKALNFEDGIYGEEGIA